MDTLGNSRVPKVICPACKGTATGPKYPGTGGCNICEGNGVIEIHSKFIQSTLWEEKAESSDNSEIGYKIN